MSRNLKSLFVLLDILSVGVSFFWAYVARYGVVPTQIEVTPKNLFSIGFIISAYYVFGGYSYQNSHFKFKETLYLLGACVCAGIGIIFVAYFNREPVEGFLSRGVFFTGMAFFWVLSSLYRSVTAKQVRLRLRRSKILVICDNEYFDAFKKDVFKHHQGEAYHFIVDGLSGSNILGEIADLQGHLSQDWSCIIVGVQAARLQKLEALLLKTRMKGTPIYSFVDYYEQKWGKIPVYNLSHTWLIFTGGFHLLRTTLRFRMKRFMDIVFSTLLLVLSLPVLILVILISFITSGKSPFFWQKRSGELSVPFYIVKLRTMRVDAEAGGPQWASSNDQRVTYLGRFLRKTRIDELPQLFNVLRGDMSLVGPRPERPEFDETLKQKIPFYDLRYQVKPGITGWAQVCYRYGASVEDAQEKLQYDLYYIKNYSLFLDINIILKTIRVVLKGAGV